MNSEKYELNAETRRHYIIMTLFRGFKKIFTGWKTALAYMAVMLALGLLFRLSCAGADGLAAAIQAFSLKVLYLMLFPMVVYVFGHVRGSFRAYRNLVRAGVTNKAGEAPVLIHRHRDGKAEELTFEIKGIPLDDWRKQRAVIETALNMTIDRIRQGKDMRTIIIRAVPAYVQFPAVIPWDDSFLAEDEAVFRMGKTIADEMVEIDIDKQPMILLAGSTGSGKTNLAICLCQQALLHDADVKVIDFKGVDFYDLKKMGVAILTEPMSILAALKDAEAEINRRQQIFEEIECDKIGTYRAKTGCDMKRQIILIDECAMLINYGTSKESKNFSEEVSDLICGIVRVGRAFGVHLIISTQRPDQRAVPGPIKSNFDVHICGKADTTLSEIALGDGRADQLIPKNAQGRFVMGGDGDDDIVFQAFYVEKR